MIEKDQIKYTSLSEAREDLIKESKLAQLQYRDSEQRRTSKETKGIRGAI